MDERLTKNFTRSEFECRCGCKTYNLDHLLLITLQEFRDRLQRPIVVSSGCRCQQHNKAVGGAEHSFHIATAQTVCHAVDIHVVGLSAVELMAAVETWDKCLRFRGLGLYPDSGVNFIHIDTRRNSVSRWKRINGEYITVEKF